MMDFLKYKIHFEYEWVKIACLYNFLRKIVITVMSITESNHTTKNKGYSFWQTTLL